MAKMLHFVQHDNEEVISLPAERFVRIVEEVIMKTENDFIKFLTVNDKADIDERRTLRDHIDITLLQRSESLLEHTVQTHYILSDD